MSKPRKFDKPDIASDNVWEDLIISILSVNQYKLQSTYSKVSSLRLVGIFAPQNLKTWTSEEIKNRLISGDCDRGSFMTHLFAERLSSLGELVRKRGVSECERVLLSEDKGLITELLMPVRGVGEKVLENLFMLRDLS